MHEKQNKKTHERNIRVHYDPDLQSIVCRKRVAAYARVSSEKEQAIHSLSAQISYYQEKIAGHPDWEFVEVFSDRGITGTKEQREGFQRMMTACREGRIDIVLVKSITRFARNTVILLSAIRELKGLGVDIHFEEEGIRTLSAKGEFLISVLAARAQEESRQVSENKKWQYRKAFEKGIPFGSDCLGYRVADHRIRLEEDEVPLVRRIFDMYLSGIGAAGIARRLTEEGAKTRRGTDSWSDGLIRSMLRNEIYCGDLRLQKTYRTDYVSGKTRKNRGERKMFYIRDDHSAIIPREVFERVQRELDCRSVPCPAGAGPSPFSKLIVCAACGRHLCRKTVNARSEKRWECVQAIHYGKTGCPLTRTVTDSELHEITCRAIGVESLDGVNLRDRVREIVHTEAHELRFVITDGTEKTFPVRGRYR